MSQLFVNPTKALIATTISVTPPVNAEMNNPDVKVQNFKTKLCASVINPNTKCTFGSRCIFAHSMSELRQQVDLKKTSLCLDYEQGKCNRINCKYAHGVHELKNQNQQNLHQLHPDLIAATINARNKSGLSSKPSKMAEEDLRRISVATTASSCSNGHDRRFSIPHSVYENMSKFTSEDKLPQTYYILPMVPMVPVFAPNQDHRRQSQYELQHSHSAHPSSFAASGLTETQTVNIASSQTVVLSTPTIKPMTSSNTSASSSPPLHFQVASQRYEKLNESSSTNSCSYISLKGGNNGHIRLDENSSPHLWSYALWLQSEEC